MIHGTYGSTVTSYLSVLESKINTSVVDSKLRWLFKFTNDMTKTIKYSYGNIVSTNDRFIKQTFSHNATENIFTGVMKFTKLVG